MINSLLRSGCPDDFLTLGENGLAVFDSAWQIRETLRLRNYQAIADTLAIPQINDSGSRIDWYAPNPGRITRWATASEEQRVTAIHHLEHCWANVTLLSRQCLHSDKIVLQLFGSLLTQILQFPASQYIYLVDGKPVITFWGFVNQNETIRENSLACLQVRTINTPLTAPTTRAIETALISEKGCEPEPSLIPPSRPDLAAAYAADIELAAETDIVSVENTAPRSFRRWLLAITFLALVVVLAGSLYLILHPEEETTAVVEAGQSQMVEPAEPARVAEIPTSTLPLIQATVIPQKSVKPPVPTVLSQPRPKGALVLPADELKMGSTQFLNGTWLVRVQFSDPITGKPPGLRYRIVKNKGSARLIISDNVTCKAQIFSGLHESGILMIKSRSNARCDDGTRHVLPEISCKAGIDGIAECTGRYKGANLVPVTIQKVSN